MPKGSISHYLKKNFDYILLFEADDVVHLTYFFYNICISLIKGALNEFVYR